MPSKTTVVADANLKWETWSDPTIGRKSPARWKLLFSAGRTATEGFSMGVAEIPPGATLLLHHHGPQEAYYVLAGTGTTEIDGIRHLVRPGTALYIPQNAKHRTTNTGTAPLRFLFVFPTDSFDEVVYHFDE